MEKKPTKAQKDAINHTGGNLQIIACAGSGKTEVISRRIAKIIKDENVNPRDIIAFTFTEKAAESLKKRIETAVGESVADMYVGTIHGFCRYLLQQYSGKFSDFKILDSVKNHLFINRYTNQCGMKQLNLTPSVSGDKLFLECIDKLIDDYDNRGNWDATQTSVLEQYVDCLYKHNYIDFSLLIFEALKQISSNSAVQKYLSGIRHLIVDEYQDVNDLQEKLISAISSFGAKVCVVGDDDQTIYRFRGSNAENMIGFADRYRDVYKVRLEENFRCKKGIVDVAGCVIRHNNRRLEKQMISESTMGTVCARGYLSADDESSAIADKIIQIHSQGVQYSKIAVLVRKRKQVELIAKKLDDRGIPYEADSSEKFFSGDCFDRFVETIRILENINKENLYLQWNDIIDNERLNTGYRYLRTCARGGHYRLSEIIRCFCEKIGFPIENSPDFNSCFEKLEGFCKILDDYDEIYGDYQLSARVSGLLRFLGTRAKEEYKNHSFRVKDEKAEAVHLMTIHKSKGLEFDTVFLPGLNNGEFPVRKMGGEKYYHVLGGTFADNKEKYETDIEDERKLFYVAVTRAERNLYMSYILGKKAISDFIYEAAESDALEIDHSELEMFKKKKYEINIVNEAKEKLYDYFSDANHFCPGIILEYSDVCAKGAEAIVAKAQEYGLI